MSWGRFWLLSEWGIDDTSRRWHDIHRAAAQAGKNVAHDEQIATLRRENQELKLYLAGLMQLLVGKGTVSPDDVRNLIELVERAQEESHRSEAEPSSADLEALAAAARQSSRG